jgi:hypothetical protein|tara:strand:- start:615 stop:932 length:318 start_codon:yes stop_codon:yes gene_type:complete
MGTRLLNKQQIREEIYTDIIQEHCDLSQDQISDIVDQEMKRLGLGKKIKLDLTDIEHNVLLVALDTLEEQLNDIRNDLDTYEDEATNLNRLVAIKNLKQILKDYE